ncbi:hypothetical protein PanWU01x14_048630 [Parasponia andersonii]|uniref:Uncharacterized protein n=1 Tax=Parasponia andersonii TaxID=3476 RepID=A0A2P5DNE8_PARAD|nr:hypothetical protein PanWU01x14_048630 [Parasponia andersonii]
MEGLIPYLLHALKKDRPKNSYRSLSDTSNRSYHRLLSGSTHNNLPDGSSHRRTRSEFQPPPPLDFLEHRSLSYNRGLPSPASMEACDRINGVDGRSYSNYQSYNLGVDHAASNNSGLSHRRKKVT